MSEEPEEVLRYLARVEAWPPCRGCGSEDVCAVVHPSDFDDVMRMLEASERGALPGVVLDDHLGGTRAKPPQWECRSCGHRFDSDVPRYQR